MLRARLLMLVLLASGSAGATSVPSLTGMWDAAVVVNDLSIPFRFQIDQRAATVSGSFFNGDEKVTSRSGLFKAGQLTLVYPEYGTTLQATLKDVHLDGQYLRATRPPFPFHAVRFTPPPSVRNVPNIAGLWNVQLTPPARELAWHLVVRQSGAEVSTARSIVRRLSEHFALV